jgi:hypothetical protein
VPLGSPRWSVTSALHTAAASKRTAPAGLAPVERGFCPTRRPPRDGPSPPGSPRWSEASALQAPSPECTSPGSTEASSAGARSRSAVSAGVQKPRLYRGKLGRGPLPQRGFRRSAEALALPRQARQGPDSAAPPAPTGLAPVGQGFCPTRRRQPIWPHDWQMASLPSLS